MDVASECDSCENGHRLGYALQVEDISPGFGFGVRESNTRVGNLNPKNL